MPRLSSLLPLLTTLSLVVSPGCRDDKLDSGGDSNDTNGVIDDDGDGVPVGEDCDDSDATVNPDAREVCDGIDNDCDGLIDDEDTGVYGIDTWYLDADGDGYGQDAVTVEACEAPDSYVESRGDCNDLDADSNPDAIEVCDGVDNDCDSVIDGDDASDALTWYEDNDGDGYGTTASVETACDPPAGYAMHDGDCDDASPTYHPGASEADCTDANDYNCDGSVGFDDADADGFAACEDCDDSDADVNDDAAEICDGFDNDCDALIDDSDPSVTGGSTWYADSDGDGHGGQQFEVEACVASAGFVATSDDCDDLDAASHPGASEVCDDADNDCDTEIDEGVGSTWYADSDGDGYGNGSVTVDSCDAPSGYVGNALDCDDFSATTSPASYEVCDSADNDCDGSVDEDAINASTWYVDGDLDGYGTLSATTSACSAPTGYASNATDCDDSDSSVNPGAAEVCDDADNNCDGSTDEGVTTTYYADTDSDGYGDASSTMDACSLPTSGYVTDSTDCDDAESTSYPTNTEVCDGLDNNCDGSTDEGVTTTYYADTDSDGYGDASATMEACSLPTSGYVTDATDCDDGDGQTYPGATTLCDGEDRNCDGSLDENDGQAQSCAATSCKAIYDAGLSAGDGNYYLDPEGDGTTFEAYCDMGFEGGGWISVYNRTYPTLSLGNFQSSYNTQGSMSAPVTPTVESTYVATDDLPMSTYTEVVYGWAPAGSTVTRWGTYTKSGGLQGECLVDTSCSSGTTISNMDIYPENLNRSIYIQHDQDSQSGIGRGGWECLWGYDANDGLNGSSGGSNSSHWCNWDVNDSGWIPGNNSEINTSGWRYVIYLR